MFSFILFFNATKRNFYLQNVPPAMLVRFLREHRSEWADFNVDAYAAASLKSTYAYPGMRPTRFTGSQIIMPLGHAIEHEEVHIFIWLSFTLHTNLTFWYLNFLN